MKLAVYLHTRDPQTLALMRQIGVNEVVAGVPENNAGMFEDYRALVLQRNAALDAGLDLSTVESLRIDDAIKLGLSGRDEAMDVFCRQLRNVGAAGIEVVCYNFMAAFNWLRTSVTTRTRGDALTSSYDHKWMQNAPQTKYGTVTDEQMWDNFAWFLERAVPVAEEAGVKLALHPDDPPLSPIAGISRIMRSVENFERVLSLSTSPANGITFCQGNFDAMGADVPAAIEHFKSRIYFVHFRDVRGTVPAFQEQFHDDTDGDMAAVMRALRNIGFQRAIRPDHTPNLAGESNEHAGYAILGRLHAIGYMQGLLAAIDSGGSGS